MPNGRLINILLIFDRVVVALVAGALLTNVSNAAKRDTSLASVRREEPTDALTANRRATFHAIARLRRR